MSLQWTLVAGFLYIEMAVALLLLLPFISAKRWHSLFKSRFLKALEGQSFFYFCVLILMLVLLLLDAIREMRKYSDDSEKEQPHGHLDLEIQNHMRLFRAQRNFYISGFALFLFLVLRRMTSLISAQAVLEASNEAAMRQAVSASNAAQKMMTGQDLSSATATEQLKELKETTQQLQKERDSALKKCEAMQMQAESTSREYDRLMGEHAELQRQLDDGDKKRD